MRLLLTLLFLSLSCLPVLAGPGDDGDEIPVPFALPEAQRAEVTAQIQAILDGETEVEYLWEDDATFAFAHPRPQCELHALIFARDAAFSAPNDLGPPEAELVGHLVGVGIILARMAKIADATDGPGFTVLTHNGAAHGQLIDRLYFEVIGGAPLPAEADE